MLRTTFDEVAELYDAVRPTYPVEMVEAVRSVLQEMPGRILEIGCGTGQATLPFARLGYPITALEPGPNLAALAAKNLAAYPQVDIQTTTFEEWPAAANQYDLVLSATAFHWVSPDVRYTKSAQALAAKGWLAVFWNTGADDESALGQQINAAYDKHMPSTQVHPYVTHHPAGRSTQQGPKISRWQEEIDQSQLFRNVNVMQFPWTQWYATERYLQLLETYSDHHVLPPQNKREFFDEIAGILERHGGGRNMPYLTVLYLAQVKNL